MTNHPEDLHVRNPAHAFENRSHVGTRARVDTGGAVPSHAELREEALRTLRDVALNGSKEDGPRVAAAKAILEATSPDVRDHILKLMDGDKTRYIEFLRAELAAMEAA